jgi:hypothetical protein
MFDDIASILRAQLQGAATGAPSTASEEQQLQALIAALSPPEQQAALQAQLEQAIAAGQRPGVRYTSPNAAIWGGLADIVRSGSSALKERDIRGKQAEQGKKLAEARAAFAKQAQGGSMPDVAALFGDDPEAAKGAMAALADVARKRQSLSGMAMASGDPTLTGFAQMGMKAAGDDMDLVTQAGLARARRKEAPRPQYSVVTGKDGAQYFVDPHNPSAMAIPVMAPDGKQLAKPPHEGMPIVVVGEGGQPVLINPKSGVGTPAVDASGKPIVKQAPPPKALSHPEKEALASAFSDAASVKELLGTFKDGYAGGGLLGGANVAGAQTLGSWAPKDAQDAAKWWANFNRMVDLPQRNKVFGASLSAGEKASWEGAKNIRPGVDSSVAREALQKMSAILEGKAGAYADALKAEGYKPEAVDALSGGGNRGAKTPVSKQVNRALGKTRITFSDGTTEVLDGIQ